MSVLNKQLFGKTSVQPLPKKEQQQFEKLYNKLDNKQYSEGIKITKRILNKVPNHGETLALKALFLRSLYPEKKEEAYDLVQQGLTADKASYICWHVEALLRKADREYEKALHAYRNTALKDKDAISLLREIGSLEIQVRDYHNNLETRRKIIKLEPQTPKNWISFAIATYLVKDFNTTLKVLDEFANRVKAQDEYDTSELLLFRTQVLFAAGKHEEALNYALSTENRIVDKIALKELRGDIFIQTQKWEEARNQFIELLKINPENHLYHDKIRTIISSLAKQHSRDETKDLLNLYTELAHLFPRATATEILPLRFIPSGEEFGTKLAAFVQPRVRSGKPSLYKELKSVYTSFEGTTKEKQIETLFESYLTTLKTTQKFVESQQDTENPTCILFILYFLAQHYAKSNQEKAMSLIEEAIQHTPTLINLYICKAKIYKCSGNPIEASSTLEDARKLDLADRYLNTKSVRYLLRAELRARADKVVALFTKGENKIQTVDFDDSDSNLAGDNLKEMQASWYEIELAESHLRSKRYSDAWKQYKNIEKHFEDFVDDEYDFHAYCYSKMKTRVYLDMLKWEDEMYKHRFYIRMAEGALNVWLAVVNGLTSEIEGVPKALWAPDGSHPDIAKYVSKLEQFSQNNCSSLLTCFEVNLKRKKYLLCLANLKKANVSKPGDADVFHGFFKLWTTLKADSTFAPALATVVFNDLNSLLWDGKGERDIQAVFEDKLQNNLSLGWSRGLLQVLSVESVKAQKDKIIGLVLDGIKKSLSDDVAEARNLVAVVENLFGQESQENEKVRLACKNKWTLSGCFVNPVVGTF